MKIDYIIAELNKVAFNINDEDSSPRIIELSDELQKMYSREMRPLNNHPQSDAKKVENE